MEVQIYNSACSKIKINFSSSVESLEEQSQSDSDSKYLIYESDDVTAVLRVTFEEVPPDPDYSGWRLWVQLNGTAQEVSFANDSSGSLTIETNPVSDRYSKYGSRKFNRTEASQNYENYGDGTYRNFDLLDYVADVESIEYDENGNEIISTTPLNVIRIESVFNGRWLYGFASEPIYLDTSTTETPIAGITEGGALIDLSTGEAMTGYRVKVYKQPDNDNPVATYAFSGDPRAVVVECLSQLCRDGCIPLWDSRFENKMCLCDPKETGAQYDEFPNLDQDSRTWKL